MPVHVGSRQYMFITSAVLGFIIGLLVFKKHEPNELDLKVKYVTAGDP